MTASTTDVMRVLAEPCRTPQMPAVGLPDELRQAVASADLCRRAVDGVEDHPRLHRLAKAARLQGIRWLFQAQPSASAMDDPGLVRLFAPCRGHDPHRKSLIGDVAVGNRGIRQRPSICTLMRVAPAA